MRLVVIASVALFALPALGEDAGVIELPPVIVPLPPPPTFQTPRRPRSATRLLPPPSSRRSRASPKRKMRQSSWPPLPAP